MKIARLRAGNEKCGKISLLLNTTLGPVISFCLCIASQSNRKELSTFINPLLLARVLGEGGKSKTDATDPLNKVKSG